MNLYEYILVRTILGDFLCLIWFMGYVYDEGFEWLICGGVFW
jgi:hypothetical protein